MKSARPLLYSVVVIPRTLVAFFAVLFLSGQTPPYSRSLFGDWQDFDRDCQDTRAEILISRSLVPVKFTTPKACRVSSGLWIDEYTGDLIRNASEIDIDHLVPLAEAYRTGADTWDAQKRIQYANDPSVLAITTFKMNRSKGDKGPTKWLPVNPAARCFYLYRWAGIKTAYGLSETDVEKVVLNSCANP